MIPSSYPRRNTPAPIKSSEGLSSAVQTASKGNASCTQQHCTPHSVGGRGTHPGFDAVISEGSPPWACWPHRPCLAGACWRPGASARQSPPAPRRRSCAHLAGRQPHPVHCDSRCHSHARQQRKPLYCAHGFQVQQRAQPGLQEDLACAQVILRTQVQVLILLSAYTAAMVQPATWQVHSRDYTSNLLSTRGGHLIVYVTVCYRARNEERCAAGEKIENTRGAHLPAKSLSDRCAQPAPLLLCGRLLLSQRLCSLCLLS